MSIDPTITLDSASARMSQPKVDLLRGSTPNFEDETRELLRQRLFAAAVAFGGILLYAFAGNLVLGNFELWWVRLFFLLGYAGLLVFLWRPNKLTWQIRFCELLVFGLFYLQLLLMMTTRLKNYAAVSDVGSVAAVRFGYLGAFSILILAYGIFVPNRWQRGALVLIPMAAVPYLVFWAQSLQDSQVAESFQAIEYTSPIPIMMMAVAVAIMGTHTVNTVRRIAFQARKFGQYRLGRRIGTGGMGQVFEAEHVLLKRPCAIKLIHAQNEQDEVAVRSFEREVKATAKLTHWNTIEIYDYGRTDDGTFYYVMELLEGKSLGELIDRHGALSEGRVAYLLRQLCEALQEAHDVGLIHRDIKPANIFVTRLGRQFDVLKLLDFGLVKVQKHAEGAGEESSTFSGTPVYMSPEQAIAYESVDGRSDIYSIGCVAYVALTGQPPFVRSDLMSMLKAHAQDEVAPPSSLNPAITSDMDAIILKCLAKEPVDRYESPESLALDLQQLRPAKPWSNLEAARWWDFNLANELESNEEDDDMEATMIMPQLDSNGE